MNIRERIEAFYSGEKPDIIPFTVYRNQWLRNNNDPIWEKLFEQGLGVTLGHRTFKTEKKNVEYKEEFFVQDGKKLQRISMSTPVGDVYMLKEGNWRLKYWIDKPEDYKVLKYISDNTEILPCYDEYLKWEKEIPYYVVSEVNIHRTPLQIILVDYLGLENFAFHFYDYRDEMMELYDSMLNNFIKSAEVIAGGPGRFVKSLENFTAESLGPKVYEQYLLPVYERCFPMIKSSGKVVGTHYDGRLDSCKELIKNAPIDIIESLTPPPEGDMTLDECRRSWPDKLFWSNINVGVYQLPPKELKETIWQRIKQASPDGRKLAFEVSEQLPANWRESIPVVLEALREAGN